MKPRPGRTGFPGCIMARFSMLDISLVRRDPERVRRALRRRGLDPSTVDELLRFDEEYRSALTVAERAKAEKNRLSAEIGKASDKAAAARELRPKIEALSSEISGAEARAGRLAVTNEDSPLRALLDNTPNLVDDSVPDGFDESANVEVRRGESRAPSTLRFGRTGSLARSSASSTSLAPRSSREAASPSSPVRAPAYRAHSKPSSSIAPSGAATLKSRRRCWFRARRCGRRGN